MVVSGLLFRKCGIVLVLGVGRGVVVGKILGLFVRMWCRFRW